MTIDPSSVEGWLFLHPSAVPERWANRAVTVAMVPLLPDEAVNVLEDGTTRPLVEPSDESLIRLVAKGKAIATIARELGIGARTVDRRLDRIRTRYGIGSKAEMAAFFAERGFGSDAKDA
jgi:DNA-binding NarL/FixJ family response regulator